jgi:hypothetical protein
MKNVKGGTIFCCIYSADRKFRDCANVGSVKEAQSAANFVADTTDLGNIRYCCSSCQSAGVIA